MKKEIPRQKKNIFYLSISILLGMGFIIIGVLIFYRISQPITQVLNKENVSASKTSIPRDSSPSHLFTSATLGINLPWLDHHDGKVSENWLGKSYEPDKVEGDLAEIRSLGITKIRSWCQMESVSSYNGKEFSLYEPYVAHLDDFLQRAEGYGISVICVMGDGHGPETIENFDGNLRWNLITSEEGIATYLKAYEAYIHHFSKHKNILMWELINEPYGSITWSESAKKFEITPNIVHSFLVQAYASVKKIANNVPVGFSDYEEQQQPKYQLFSSDQMRETYVDDCTDIYSMHIYRAYAGEVSDFSSLTNKPVWVVELGSYNYSDPDATEHTLRAWNELYDETRNYYAVTEIASKLRLSGVSLIMPWAFTSNEGMVVHEPNGTHTLKRLPLWIKQTLLPQNN